MDQLGWLIGIATNHDVLVYGLIIVLACAEGPILSILSGLLLRLGLLSFPLVYIALMLGDLIGDTVWYLIGRNTGRKIVDSRIGRRLGITDVGIAKVEGLFHRYRNSILFVSKISNGFGFAIVTLMTAGMVKIPFWKYIGINLLGQFIWSGMLIGVGYFFSSLYYQYDNYSGRILIIIVFIALVVGFIFYSRYAKKRLEAMGL